MRGKTELAASTDCFGNPFVCWSDMFKTCDIYCVLRNVFKIVAYNFRKLYFIYRIHIKPFLRCKLWDMRSVKTGSHEEWFIIFLFKLFLALKQQFESLAYLYPVQGKFPNPKACDLRKERFSFSAVGQSHRSFLHK